MFSLISLRYPNTVRTAKKANVCYLIFLMFRETEAIERRREEEEKIAACYLVVHPCCLTCSFLPVQYLLLVFVLDFAATLLQGKLGVVTVQRFPPSTQSIPQSSKTCRLKCWWFLLAEFGTNMVLMVKMCFDVSSSLCS